MYKCNFCKANLIYDFVDLGLSPISNKFASSNAVPEIFYPLSTAVCSECFLVQLKNTQDCTEHFNEDYVYFSSFSSSWLAHAKNYVEKISERLDLNEDSQVIEIASNDGYLLQYFDKEVKVLGIEPSESVAKVARKKGINTLSDFFGTSLAASLPAADLICGANVLAHVPDINDFVEGIRTVLKPQGTVTMEFPHLLELIGNNQFDTIYHEHYSYLSLFAVEKIFNAHGLKIYDVEKLATHGGSLRIYGMHGDVQKEETESLKRAREEEREFGLNEIKTYEEFYEKVKETKRNLLSLLINLKREGKKIVAYGAAAKGNTLLNYCGIGKDFIDYVIDKNPTKQGKFLPGTRIPVYSPEVLQQIPADYILILPWNLKDEIMEELKTHKNFIVPIPDPCVITR